MILRNIGVSRIVLVAVTCFATACDSGSPSKTADEFAADSALAADLALANRDTLLVDSIGAYREPNAAESDTSRDTASVARDTTKKPQQVAAAPAPAARIAPVPKEPAPTAAPVTKPAAPAANTAKPAASAPKLKGLRACSSPPAENQSECLRVSLAGVDSRLNRIYRALITEMRLQEKVPPGAKDPPSVQRLRVAQRSWLVYRDNECRKRGKGKEGALWARSRAKCLGEFSARRANELADDFSRLTAH